MKNRIRAEILAPAGNNEMLTAAVRCGADAVYLGLKDFSARRNAENFSLKELKTAIDYCHIRSVKVYLALNILIKEEELESAVETARQAYNAGVDGIIVQDLGLARLLHRNIPELPLHASTQMSVHSPSALNLLKELGFCQVVAAREMSKDELKSLCDKAESLGITVEVFVHGALCMSVSGQCLLSAFLGSRSGNRGLCAGPCRLPFNVKNGTGYDLSLKDLSLFHYINELYSMGVGSFKIEGRMKRPEYVAAAVTACKQARDNGSIEETLELTLKNVFSRSGFTAGYYESKLGKEMFGIRTKEDVLSADKAFPVLHELYRNERKSVPVGITAKIKRDKPITLTVSDKDNNSVTVTGQVPDIAQNKPITYENVIKNISKLGGTPYYDEGGGVDLDDGLFVSAGELNALRRKAVEELDYERCRLNRKESDYRYKNELELSQKAHKNLSFARFKSIEQIPDNLDCIDALILPLEKCFNKVLKLNLPIIADVPRGVSNENIVLKQMKSFKEQGGKTVLCGNLSSVSLGLEAGLRVLADTGINITNSESFKQLEEFGVKGGVISPEQTVTEIKQIKTQLEIGAVIYGNIPLMLFRNCPLKNGISCKDCKKDGVITDRLGVEFPIECRNGYSEMYNSVPLWLFDKTENIHNFDFKILYFTRESKERAAEVLKSYKNLLPPDTKHTRGLYYRGSL